MIVLKSFHELAKYKDVFRKKDTGEVKKNDIEVVKTTPKPINSSNVIVTKHAIDQYRKKVAQWLDVSVSMEDQIKSVLRKVVERGQKVKRLPGNAWQYKYKNIQVVASYEGKKIIIITCLGDKKYCSYFRKTNGKRWVVNI